jgi:hypothetical protein
LRSSILSALEQDVDATVKQALVRKDVAEFEQTCALRDPEERSLFRAVIIRTYFSTNWLTANFF